MIEEIKVWKTLFITELIEFMDEEEGPYPENGDEILTKKAELIRHKWEDFLKKEYPDTKIIINLFINNTDIYQDCDKINVQIKSSEYTGPLYAQIRYKLEQIVFDVLLYNKSREGK